MGKAVLILIADPNPFVRSFLTRELSIAGYQTVEAATSKDIFDRLNARDSSGSSGDGTRFTRQSRNQCAAKDSKSRSNDPPDYLYPSLGI